MFSDSGSRSGPSRQDLSVDYADVAFIFYIDRHVHNATIQRSVMRTRTSVPATSATAGLPTEGFEDCRIELRNRRSELFSLMWMCCRTRHPCWLVATEGRVVAGNMAKPLIGHQSAKIYVGPRLQVIASPGGTILWVSGQMPGSTHDAAAARIWNIPAALQEARLIALGDKGCHGYDQARPDDHPYKGKMKSSLADEFERGNSEQACQNM